MREHYRWRSSAQLMPYALKGHSEWEAMGEAVGFKKTGGFTLAFTEDEAELLYERQALKADAGVPITLCPIMHCELRSKISAIKFCASYCLNGYKFITHRSILSLTFKRERRAISEKCNVKLITRNSSGFNLTTSCGTVHATRLLLQQGPGLNP